MKQLYELNLSTGADSETVRFGMRSFTFDAETGRALLNGKPYFMRGTNVCIFRFFEDPDRDILPWNNEWAIRLHQQFKDMHWNSIRYCIGPPPKRWYDIADSLGFLIQNEYPIWTGAGRYNDFYSAVTPERMAGEFRAWMSEYWNHPGVVIWDAQNESVTNVTGKAIKQVRDMDLSGRPWDNGWSAPVSEHDPIESHPYLFRRYFKGNPRVDAPSEKGPLADLLHSPLVPDNGPNQHDPPPTGRYKNPIIINEYAWLWLNRDGSTTTLTDRVYDAAFGKDLTTEQRFNIFARHLGILTEYWRAHRKAAAVMHFCGLGYSRPREPRGQTSDHFIDIKNLTYEPQFVKYVKPAFSPVGLMIHFWDKTIFPGAEKEIEVYVINDTGTDWQGKLTLQIQQEGQQVTGQEREITVQALEREIIKFEIIMPSETGNYQLTAKINFQNEPVISMREFIIE